MHRTILALLLGALSVAACSKDTADETTATDTPAIAPVPLPPPADPAAVTRPSDEMIADGIRERFEVMGGMKDVTVAVDSGVAKIGGTVRTEDRVATASDVARELGATSVENTITVKR
jgi:osmotically-inducible protein OsmY